MFTPASLRRSVTAMGRKDTVSTTANDCTVEHEREHERSILKITELKEESELQQLHNEYDKTLESVAQSKATHTRSAFLEQLRNLPAPERTAIENMLIILFSTILPNPYHGKDRAEHTNYIRTCDKIFLCDSGCHPSDLDKINFAVQYLHGNVDTV